MGIDRRSEEGKQSFNRATSDDETACVKAFFIKGNCINCDFIGKKEKTRVVVIVSQSNRISEMIHYA